MSTTHDYHDLPALRGQDASGQPQPSGVRGGREFWRALKRSGALGEVGRNGFEVRNQRPLPTRVPNAAGENND